MNNTRPGMVLPLLNEKLHTSRSEGEADQLFTPSSKRPKIDAVNSNKSIVLWRDFLDGIKRRKRLLIQIREQARSSGTSPDIIRQQMLELRQVTLRLVEDALEIEYRGKMIVGNSNKISMTSSGLPKLQSYHEIEEREDLVALADIISDSDDIYKFPNIRAFLPPDFPKTRNPFLFGKSVDDLVDFVAPRAEPGNIEEELKVLELMRFKRASKALLRAEAQALNKLPISLSDLENLWIRKERDSELNIIVRAACTVMFNRSSETKFSPILNFLTDPQILIEPQGVLKRLNNYGVFDGLPAIAEAAVRHSLRECSFSGINDSAALFLIEWMVALIGNLGSDVNVTTTAMSSSGTPVKQRSKIALSKNEVSWGDMISGSGLGLQRPPSQGGQIVDPNDDGVLLRSIENTEFVSNFSQLSATNKLSKKDSTKRGLRRRSKSNELPIESSAPSTQQVKREVEKILKKHGIGRSHNHITDGGGDGETLEPETLSALRYELVKMQQELMRRKVLDGKYYSALSVDTLFPQRDREYQAVSHGNRVSDNKLSDSAATKSSNIPAKVSKTDNGNNSDKEVQILEAAGVFYNGDQVYMHIYIYTYLFICNTTYFYIYIYIYI
jgi:hypothetical protein